MCTSKNARKLHALRQNPAVALTIDTEVHPPHVLLIRGQAELDAVDHIPDEYLQTNGAYAMTPEQRSEWEAGTLTGSHRRVSSAAAPCCHGYGGGRWPACHGRYVVFARGRRPCAARA
jgi:hypothetical protein